MFGKNLHPRRSWMGNNSLPRREREKFRQRQEMLAAGLELFSEKGYHNVSMNEIARKSEFAIGTLYKFFKNKEDLYKALVLEKSDKIHDAVMKAIEDPDDEIEKLRNYVRVKRQFFHDNVPVIRLYFAETRGASFNIVAGLDREIREQYGHFLEALASVFKRGIKRKRFMRIADPYYLAVAIESLTNAFLLLWLEAPERHPYPEDPDTILNILFKGLIAV
jgi:AcrR family transcriptional regulator